MEVSLNIKITLLEVSSLTLEYDSNYTTSNHLKEDWENYNPNEIITYSTKEVD